MLLPGIHKVRSILRSRLGDDSTVASDVHQTYDDLSSVNTDMEIDENLLDDMELDLLDPETAPAEANGQSPQSAIPKDQGPVNPKSPPKVPRVQFSHDNSQPPNTQVYFPAVTVATDLWTQLVYSPLNPSDEQRKKWDDRTEAYYLDQADKKHMRPIDMKDLINVVHYLELQGMDPQAYIFSYDELLHALLNLQVTIMISIYGFLPPIVRDTLWIPTRHCILTDVPFAEACAQTKHAWWRQEGSVPSPDHMVEYICWHEYFINRSDEPQAMVMSRYMAMTPQELSKHMLEAHQLWTEILSGTRPPILHGQPSSDGEESL